jgi:hypothetical protein
METNTKTDHQIQEGTVLDLHFSYGSKMVETKGYVKSILADSLIITLDIDDKNMTLPVGTDIYIFKKGTLYNTVDADNFPEIKVSRIHRRNHARVNDILKVDYKKISQEYHNQHSDTPQIIFNDIFGESYKIPEIDNVNLKILYELIYQVSMKVDYILDALENRDMKTYSSVTSEYVNISAAGMRFDSPTLFHVNDLIAIRVSLPLTTSVCVNVVGKVVSATESEPKGSYTIRVQFLDLSEDDREIIIKYVFKRQRELLRG